MLYSVDTQGSQIVVHLFVTYPEDEVLGILGQTLRLPPLGRLLVIGRPLQQLASLSVNVHLLEVEAHALNVSLPIVP